MLRYRLFAKCNDDILTRIYPDWAKRLEEATPLVQLNSALDAVQICLKHGRFLANKQSGRRIFISASDE
jgi:hypothetical protein